MNYNPLYDPATDNLPIDPQVQSQTINDPKKDPNGINPEDKEFLNLIMKLFKEKKINPYSPSTLINKEIYNKLTRENQAIIEIEAFNMLSKLRTIKDLYNAGYRDTFQINNMVKSLKTLKERIEEIRGDVFII